MKPPSNEAQPGVERDDEVHGDRAQPVEVRPVVQAGGPRPNLRGLSVRANLRRHHPHAVSKGKGAW